MKRTAFRGAVLTGLKSNRFEQDLNQIVQIQQNSAGFWNSCQNKFNHLM